MQVRAMEDGKIINIPNINAIGRSNKRYGEDTLNKIEIQHGEYKVLYGNIKQANDYVQQGEKVSKGQIIGDTHDSSDFYIRMYKGNEPVNPDKYIEEDLFNVFSSDIDRNTWENNIHSYSTEEFNKEYLKDFENIEVHNNLYDVLVDIKNDKSYSWHYDELVIIGNTNLYNSDLFDVEYINVEEEKNILSNFGVFIMFDKDTNKGTSINKYFREVIDLLNMNGVTSIIIHNEGIYFDIGPTQLINYKDNLENPFDKLPRDFNNKQKQTTTNNNTQENNTNNDNNKVELLASVITGEARGERMKGQIAVGAVVLNRMKDDRFPDTINEVIYQSNQFTSVTDGQINITPGEEQIKAARQALAGVDPTNGAIYFYNPDTATNRDFMMFMDTLDNKITIGNHVFAKN